MSKITIQNVLGEEMTVSLLPPWRSAYAWNCKFFTKNCPNCPHCIDRENAIAVIRQVDAKKQRRQWEPPLEETIKGVCLWGISPKILVPREKGAKKCEFFGKPKPS